MVSVFLDPSNIQNDSGSRGGLDATIVLNDGHSTTAELEVSVCSIGHDGIVLLSDEGLSGARHAWIEVTLPGEGRIRPLVHLDGSDEGRAWGHIAHLFPADRDRLSRFEAAH